MVTSVKISRTAKKKLEQLQAELVLKVGKKLSQQELLSRIIDLTKNHKDELFLSTIERREKLSEEHIQFYEGLITDWGVVTREETIDEELYG